jgi:branched-subunit amino acid aminotransferase/4-amino-4-deoxychorismate lyase
VFTTMRVAGGRCWFAEAHARRVGLARADLERAWGPADARVRVTVRPGADPVFECEPYAPPVRPWILKPVAVDAPPEAVRHKTTARGYYEAARAAAKGADDVLLHLRDGTLLECTIANILLVHGGRLTTPVATLPLLAGIARGLLLAAARTLGMEAEEARPTLADLRSADECLVSNALFVAHPVAEIAGIARFQPGETARRLRDYVVANTV